MLSWLLLAGSYALASPEAWTVLDDPTGWTDVGVRSTDIGDVRVSWRKIEAIPCVQGVVHTSTSPAVLAEVASDIETRWSNAPLTASRILHQEGRTVDYYQYLDIPDWTMTSDRYWFARGVDMDLPGGGRRFQWTRLDGAQFPEVSGPLKESGRGIEVPINYGDWLFRPDASGVEVRYRICTDSGGSLPYWLQKWAALHTLGDTVADLVREAGKRAQRQK